MCFRSVYAVKFFAHAALESFLAAKSFIHELGYGSEVNEKTGERQGRSRP